MARTDKGLTCPPFCTKVMDKVRYFGRSWHSETSQFLHAQELLQDRHTIKIRTVAKSVFIRALGLERKPASADFFMFY
jgi:hypothetical protein